MGRLLRRMPSGGITLDRGAKPSIINVQVHHQNRIPASTDGGQITSKPSATESGVRQLLISPLESRAMSARTTSGVQMQRTRYLTTPQSPHERPIITRGPEYKFTNSVEYKSQAEHHQQLNNCRPATYKEQIAEAYDADRRRVPTVDGHSAIKTEFDGITKEIQDPIDAKLYDIEIELKAAQERGDTYKMNICRDQIMQLEKQYLYFKKNSMRLLMLEHLGKSDRQTRMEKDWYRSWEDFREEVNTEKASLIEAHKDEMSVFKSEIFNVAKSASELKVSEKVHEMRREVSSLVQAGKIDEARALRERASALALSELQDQSPLVMLRDRNLEQRMAALALKQRKDNQEFENKVEAKAVGLATWRCGMEQVDK